MNRSTPGTHTVETSLLSHPARDADWFPLRVDHPLTREEACDLCRRLSSAAGANPAWRVLDEDNRQILAITGGSTS